VSAKHDTADRSTTSVTIDGVRYSFGGAQRFRAIVEAMKRPGQSVLRGCERCETICIGIERKDPLNCECCANYGANHGGGKIYWPSDGKGHRTLMTRDAFFANVESAA
jgi:hypothetical protein